MKRQGAFLGMPYNWQWPTWKELNKRIWNKSDKRLFTPKAFGWGYDINFYELLHHRKKLLAVTIIVLAVLVGFSLYSSSIIHTSILSQPTIMDKGVLSSTVTEKSEVLASEYVQPEYLLAASYSNDTKTFFLENKTSVLSIKPNWHLQVLGFDTMWQPPAGDEADPIVFPLNKRYIVTFSNLIPEYQGKDNMKIAVYDTVQKKFFYIFDNATVQEKESIYPNITVYPEKNMFSYYFVPKNNRILPSMDASKNYIIERDIQLPEFTYVDYKIPFDFSSVYNPAKENPGVTVKTLQNKMYIVLRTQDLDNNIDEGNAYPVSNHHISPLIHLNDYSQLDQDENINPFSYRFDQMQNRTDTVDAEKERQIEILTSNKELLTTVDTPALHALTMLNQSSQYLYLGVKYDCPIGNGCYDDVSTDFGVLNLETKQFIPALNNPMTRGFAGSIWYYTPTYRPVILGVE